MPDVWRTSGSNKGGCVSVHTSKLTVSNPSDHDSIQLVSDRDNVIGNKVKEMTKGPWSNVPKMSRKEAAEWKNDPLNRKEARRRMAAKVPKMPRYKIKPGINYIDFDNTKELVDFLEIMMKDKSK